MKSNPAEARPLADAYVVEFCRACWGTGGDELARPCTACKGTGRQKRWAYALNSGEQQP